jgi:DMSO/TMAO reductase YedYZ molybdopterin-dependent catalytic subunit
MWWQTMKNKATKTSLFLTLATILIITSTANMSTASASSNLQITTLSGTTTTLTSANLLNMNKTFVTADLSCYGLSVANGDWGGVKLSSLLNQAGLDPTVTSINFKAQDGYIVAISINTALRSDVIIAYELDGALLSEGLRLVVPGANGNIWIAQITLISMSTGVVEQSIGESGSAPSPAPYSEPNITTQQTTQQQQQLPTPTPSVTSKPNTQPENSIQPDPVPTNTTDSRQQNINPPNSGLSVDDGYGVVLFGFVVVLAVGLLIYRRRR